MPEQKHKYNTKTVEIHKNKPYTGRKNNIVAVGKNNVIIIIIIIIIIILLVFSFRLADISLSSVGRQGRRKMHLAWRELRKTHKTQNISEDCPGTI
jgi:hypothetical protein